jgi:glycerol kinase
MTEARWVLAIELSTASARALLFDRDGTVAAEAERELVQRHPKPGWVEHEAHEIWTACQDALLDCLGKVGAPPREIAAIGIANQRETTLLWNRRTGRAVTPAIGWQDRRTADICAKLEAAGHGALVRRRTGLSIDPAFSATKLAWILDNVPDARASAERGQLAFGTVDSYLLWQLTRGRVHATDPTNAARTLLFDIHEQRWNNELLALFGIPHAVLPEVRDCDGDFGETDEEVLGAPVKIRCLIGDQQAAAIGQACMEPGMLKATYGQGAFILLNIGNEPLWSRHRLATTIAWRIGGRTSYAMEGAILNAGTGIQWLLDNFQLFDDPEQAAMLAATADPTQPIYFVPAFNGLGVPYWDAEARGAIFGLTRRTGPAELARAALEAACFRTRDVLEALAEDGGPMASILRVDGEFAANDWAMQFLADILGVPVERPVVTETAALGAAWIAGSTTGFFPPPETRTATWQRDRLFEPQMSEAERQRHYAGWLDAVRRVGSGSGSR